LYPNDQIRIRRVWLGKRERNSYHLRLGREIGRQLQKQRGQVISGVRGIPDVYRAARDQCRAGLRPVRILFERINEIFSLFFIQGDEPFRSGFLGFFLSSRCCDQGQQEEQCAYQLASWFHTLPPPAESRSSTENLQPL